MLLLIDASRANNEQKTGVEWYAYFVIQELKQIIPLDIKVVLYTREPLKGDLAALPPNWQEKVLKWPPKRLWTQLRLSWEMLKEFGIWNLESGIKDNVVLFVPAHVLPLVCPKKVVTTIHDLGGLRFPTGYSLFERWYARFATRTALKRATVLTPSEFVKSEMEYLFKNLESPASLREAGRAGIWNINIIPNGYDSSKFHLIDDKKAIEQALKKYHIKQSYFLSISRLEEKKNTAGIIEAFEIFKKQNNNLTIEQLNNYQLVLLGKPGYGFRRVRQAIEKSDFQNDIILPGWVETEDVPYLMAGASAFIFPSFYEGFGIPILEAMACGAPVIASNRAALPEVAGNAALLINPHKPAEIAKAMAQIVFSPELRAELIKRGLERVKEYSWKKTAYLVWKIIQEYGKIDIKDITYY